MINQVKFYATRANHYGASDLEFCKVTMKVTCDSKEFNSIKKKRDPIVDIIAQTFEQRFLLGITEQGFYQLASYNNKYPRAKNGEIVINLQYYISKSKAESLGIDTRRYSFYQELTSFNAVNVTKIDFKKRIKIS